ncbi:hypothetical protein [Hymenobacter sp. UYP22]|uniref:hypothetical protein n=1 Tax=Hymenobacter sp. UYP22 TaxID=3156348 RepID=UPI003398ED1D
MKKYVAFSVFFFYYQTSYGQQISVTHKYELAGSILHELEPQALSSVKKGANGHYYWRVTPTDTPAVRLLLLDHAYAEAVPFLEKATVGTEEYSALLRHFSAADIDYMKQQMADAQNFRFDPAMIRQPWVQILSRDTLQAISSRLQRQLGWQAEYRFNDTLLYHYGSYRIYAIGEMLFAKSRKSALVAVSYGDGWDLCVYRKSGTIWRRQAVLYSVVQ